MQERRGTKLQVLPRRRGTCIYLKSRAQITYILMAIHTHIYISPEMPILEGNSQKEAWTWQVPAVIANNYVPGICNQVL